MICYQEAVRVIAANLDDLKIDIFQASDILSIMYCLPKKDTFNDLILERIEREEAKKALKTNTPRQ